MGGSVMITSAPLGSRYHGDAKRCDQDANPRTKNVTTPSAVELAYQRRMDSMSPAERVARSAAMFAWTREHLLARSLQHKVRWARMSSSGV